MRGQYKEMCSSVLINNIILSQSYSLKHVTEFALYTNLFWVWAIMKRHHSKKHWRFSTTARICKVYPMRCHCNHNTNLMTFHLEVWGSEGTSSGSEAAMGCGTYPTRERKTIFRSTRWRGYVSTRTSGYIQCYKCLSISLDFFAGIKYGKQLCWLEFHPLWNRARKRLCQQG